MQFTKRAIRCLLGAALLLGVFPMPVPAMESTWLLDGSISGLAGRDPARLDDEKTQTGGLRSSLFIMPILGWRGSSLFLSPSYDVTYSGVDTPLEVDDDLFLFSQQFINTLELGGTYKTSVDARWTAKGFFESFSGKVTKDEEWGRGLYDYQDGGGYLDWTRKWNTGIPSKTTFGYRYTDRQYFNFTSLDGTGVREKDALLHKGYVDYELAWPTQTAFLTTFSYSYTNMAFKELRIQDPNGTLVKDDGSPTDFRRDLIQTFSITAPIKGGRHHLFLAYDGEYRDSNLALLDTQSFVYLGDFNDYAEHSLTLGYGYEIKPFWFLRSPYLGLQFTSLTRGYSSRPAQDKNGAYKEAKQTDGQVQFNLDFNSTFTEHWGFFWNFNSVTYSSNNDNEGSALYNYRFVTTSLGLQFSY